MNPQSTRPPICHRAARKPGLSYSSERARKPKLMKPMQQQHHSRMTRSQRTWSALLLFLLWLPIFAVLAANEPAEAALPACCRAHGLHHCAMSLDSSKADDDTTAAAPHLSEQCPYHNTSADSAHITALYTPTSCLLFNHPIVAAAAFASYLNLSFPPYQTPRTRGPPIHTLPA
jgi:hypothetical protein